MPRRHGRGADRHPGGRFTALFEAMVIAWLGEAPIKAVAELVGLSWDQVDGIQQRAIERGLARRKPATVKNLGIDETSYQTDHEYVSVITDRDRRVVLEVLEDRKKETVLAWLDTLSAQQRQAIETVSMDMWEAFINAFLERIPDADRKVCFDRFHIASYFGKAVDAVRIDEHKALRAHGRQSLFGTSENAVKTQVWIAMSVYVLIAIVRKRLPLEHLSLWQISQVLSLTCFEKMPVDSLFLNVKTASNDPTIGKQLSFLDF